MIAAILTSSLSTAAALRRAADDCASIVDGCAACAEAGCRFASGVCGSGAPTEVSGCCEKDKTKAVGDSWLCDDGCNLCTCEASGAVVAHGCEDFSPEPSDPAAGGTDSETVVVALALVPALGCTLVCLGIMYLCFCYRKAGKALPRKELERDEEADQLAAGD